ncbi:MAG: aminopeptidase, partial [Oscillospiraceae bacterium]|nr:aminopeptidase [Oscillospiraceae bacterium]
RYLGSVKEGTPVRYLNLPIQELKRAAIAQMQDGEPVWFGCDVGKRSERDGGIMDVDLYSLETLLDTRFTMTKAERLDYGHSLMTHAMVFQGVNLDENGVPNRWRVENSWGKDPGQDGYYVMTDKWFDEYMYQVVVNKKYLTPEQLAAYEDQPIELEPWDPMGSLAD